MARREDISRESILQAAHNRMMHYGIQKSTMQEIAQDLGIAVGTLYLHFRNKDEIVLAIAESCRQKQTDLVEGILKSDLSPGEKLKTFVLEKYRHNKEYRSTYPHFDEFLKLLFNLDGQCVYNWQKRFREAIEEMLDEGVRLKVFKLADPHQTARVLSLSLQVFFPLPGEFTVLVPEEAQLLEVLDWYLGQMQEVRHAVNA